MHVGGHRQYPAYNWTCAIRHKVGHFAKVGSLSRVWMHAGGHRQCPAYNWTCAICHKVGHFAKVCCNKLAQQQTGSSQQQPNARTIRVQSQQLSQKQYLQLYTVHERATESKPTIAVQISSSTGTCSLDVLPDSEADICTAGQEVLEYLEALSY